MGEEGGCAQENQTTGGHSEWAYRPTACGETRTTTEMGPVSDPSMRNLRHVAVLFVSAAVLFAVAALLDNVSKRRLTILDSFAPPSVVFEGHAKTVGYPFWETGKAHAASKQTQPSPNNNGNSCSDFIASYWFISCCLAGKGNDRLWRTARWVQQGRHPDEAEISNEEQKKAMETLVHAGIVCSDCLVSVPLSNSRAAKAMGF